MNQAISFKIFDNATNLPENWNDFAKKNIFLSVSYLKILELSAPINMFCHYIGFFQNQKLVGIALAQFLNASQLESFGERDQCIKTFVRNFIFKNFSSRVLFVGNNMLTGQNAFSFSNHIDAIEALQAIKKAADVIKQSYKHKKQKIHLTTFKDFNNAEIKNFEMAGFRNFYTFTIQPNMILDIDSNWNSETDYCNALTKKYYQNYKRVRNKAKDIYKTKMNLEAIALHQETIYKLYFNVAKNAPFNTFFLSTNHFEIFKENLKDNFLFYGYFLNGELIGFNTLIKNGNALDTYFLGYEDKIQKEKSLYLNMLYDMVIFGINKKFSQIIFARTALEIKSSVGAKPVQLFGLIEHSNPFINKFMRWIFPYLEPKIEWKERSPFKTDKFND